VALLQIKNLKFRARHGHLDFERVIGNNFEVDLLFETDITSAAESDDLDNALDYSLAAAIVEDVINSEPVLLIETLITKIGDQLIGSFPQVAMLEVSLRKLTPPMETGCDYVELTERWEP